MEVAQEITSKRVVRSSRPGPHIPPLFGGHSRRIPQGMVSDVQPRGLSTILVPSDRLG